MASKIVVGWMWAEIHLDKEIHHLSKGQKRKILDALFYSKRRRRPVKKTPSSRVKGEKKEFDPMLMKKHFECQ